LVVRDLNPVKLEKEDIMPIRKIFLLNGEVYHVCNKSIAGFRIFNSDKDYDRMLQLMEFYNNKDAPCSFSVYKKLKNITFNASKKNVNIIAYCLMPTHIHLILKQSGDNGIEKFITKISQGYSQYFNAQHERNGPLWEGRFKNIMVKNDEQLLHLTRYVHLNPVTAFLVNDPYDWVYSSYKEYINSDRPKERLCYFDDLLKIDSNIYKKFVLDQIDYQRQLATIKNLALEG
jgi:putative transposase